MYTYRYASEALRPVQGSTACSDPAQAELLAAAGQRPAAGRLRISAKIQLWLGLLRIFSREQAACCFLGLSTW